MGNRIQAYEVLRKRDEGLWTWDGEWYESKLKRRMTLIRLRSGGLFVHSPIQLQEKDYEKLTQIGPVEYIAAPNSFHFSDAALYKKIFPKARLLVSQGCIDRVRKSCNVDGLLPGAIGDALRSELDCLEFEGTRLLNESVFFHNSSRTLIVTDLVFNMSIQTKGLEKAFFKWNRIDHRFGPSTLFKKLFLNNKKKAERSLARLLLWNFDRVIMSHGEIMEQDGKAKIIQGFEEIGLIARG